MNVFNVLYCCAFIYIFLVVTSHASSNNDPTLSSSFGNKPSSDHTDFILVGAHGDLSKKYLWSGLFDLYREYHEEGDQSITFIGAGTKNDTLGSTLLHTILLNAISCNLKDTGCFLAKEKFINQTKYKQLKSETHYENFCENLASHFPDQVCYAEDSCNYQRIFYLSIPPFAYESTASYISKHCKVKKDEGELKVVLEKPFGHNQDSALKMAEAISNVLDDKEVFRVDHYLGKQTVELITTFRQSNPLVEKMLNREHVERIEIVMKEKFGVKGRTSFYDSYGVMCDVMQNHLSEILYLLTMDLPQLNASSDEQSKLRLNLMKQILPLQPNDVLVGQYKGYKEEVIEESGSNATSYTPTFGAALFRVNTPRWKGVPMIMTAGKEMNERVGYARIVFKKRDLSPSNSDDIGCQSNQQIAFHIGHGTLKSPALLVSNKLPLARKFTPDAWHRTLSFADKTYLGMDGSSFTAFVPEIVRDAYSLLIEQLFLGKREYFVTTDGLLESWKIWANVVDLGAHSEMNPLVIYSGQENIGNSLDFKFSDGGLVFNSMLDQPIKTEETMYLKQKSLVGSASAVSKLLALHIENSATAAIRNGNTFHIAFSGGTTPIKLFQNLRQRPSFPWHNVHIWQVDERCTENDNLLNFKMMQAELLDHIHLKYQNVHPMPVQLSPGNVCSNGNEKMYEDEMRDKVGNPPVFDYIVLGLGSDGHTASLFPNNHALKENESSVVMTETENLLSPKRMTITLPVLNAAKDVAVLVTGQSKCDIIKSLYATDCKQDDQYPICKVISRNTNLKWYFSEDAFCV